MANNKFIYCINEQLKEKLSKNYNLLYARPNGSQTIYIFENSPKNVKILDFSEEEKKYMYFSNQLTF